MPAMRGRVFPGLPPRFPPRISEHFSNRLRECMDSRDEASPSTPFKRDACCVCGQGR
jgi:hypothetical protein